MNDSDIKLPDPPKLSIDDMRHHGWEKDNDLRELLQRATDEGDRICLYQNQMMDASRFGERTCLVVGPTRTFQDPPNWMDPHGGGGMPSTRMELVGEVDLEDLRTLPCDPPDACEKHGRCWTHSVWTQEEDDGG